MILKGKHEVTIFCFRTKERVLRSLVMRTMRQMKIVGHQLKMPLERKD